MNTYKISERWEDAGGNKVAVGTPGSVIIESWQGSNGPFWNYGISRDGISREYPRLTGEPPIHFMRRLLGA